MIKSKSWEISAWNPKDSVMFYVLSDEEDTGVRDREGAEERSLPEGWTIADGDPP